VFAVRRAIDDAIQKGTEGTATPETFVRVQRQLDLFKKQIESNIPRIDLADDKEAIASVTGLIDKLAGEFKRAEELSRETANIIEESFGVAFDGAKRKVVELQAQLNLSRNVAAGGNIGFDVDLLGLDEKIAEGRRLLNETTSALRSAASKSGAKIDEGGIKAIDEEFRLRSLLSLEELRKKTEEERLALEEKRRKSAKFTNFEEYNRQLQLNALLISSNKEEQERINNAENLRRVNSAINAFEGGKRFGDIATTLRPGKISAEDQAQRQASALKEAMRELLNPLGKIEQGVNRTANEVKSKDTTAKAAP